MNPKVTFPLVKQSCQEMSRHLPNSYSNTLKANNITHNTVNEQQFVVFLHRNIRGWNIISNVVTFLADITNIKYLLIHKVFKHTTDVSKAGNKQLIKAQHMECAKSRPKVMMVDRNPNKDVEFSRCKSYNMQHEILDHQFLLSCCF